MRNRMWLLVVFLAMLSTGMSALVSQAADEPYYKGKTLRILVSSSPGGGHDTAARLAARFLPKYLSGHPSTIVQNMPGGGQVVANNYLFNHAKPDGLSILQTGSSILTQFNTGRSTIKFDPRKFRAVGSIMRGSSVLMVRKDARSRVTNPAAQPVVVGDADGARDWVPMTVWGAEYLGWNLRWIVGYAGTGEMILALRQGEIEMLATANAKLIQDLVKDGVVDILAVQADEGRKDYPNVPSFVDLLGDKKPSGVSWQAYVVWAGVSAVDKLLVAPPGTPDGIMSMLRTAFNDMAKDPEFVAQARRFFGEACCVFRGAEETEKLIVHTTTVSPEVENFLHKIRKKSGLPTVKKRN